MLYKDNTTKLLNLQDFEVEKIEETETEKLIYGQLCRCEQYCPCCGAATGTIHDYRTQLNNVKAALNGMEREQNFNNNALEKADKGFNEAGDEAKDFSNSVLNAADTGKDAYGKLSKLIDTAKKIGAALGATAATVGTACVATTKKALPKQCLNGSPCWT